MISLGIDRAEDFATGEVRVELPLPQLFTPAGCGIATDALAVEIKDETLPPKLVINWTGFVADPGGRQIVGDSNQAYWRDGTTR
jgi:hypothetical protein